MPIRRLLAAGLFLAAGGVCADEAATAASADTPAPAIEVVREGEGVADVWRREGVDFPAYGPDGAPVVPGPEQQALQALANAVDVQFLGLQSVDAGDHAPGAPGICTTKSDCIGGHRVTRRVGVGSIAQYRLARRIGDGWLREPAPVVGDCKPGYGHGLAYSSDGHAWELLLGYDCGRYLIRRDGAEFASGHAAEPPAQAEFDALLGSAAAE